jgi:UDP-N-acetylmuramyl tripeptide synthase
MTAIAIILCKLLTKIGKLVGKGSSLPGKIVLKICPNILKRIKFCKYVIAVTGSNGKTSTVELISKVLTECGYKTAYNKEGSNQIEGVTTLVLNNCTLGGKVNCDAIVIESDERFARYTFSHFAPTHYVATNLYRDQLSRNGHPEMVFDCLLESIKSEDTTLILNADDPLVSLFSKNHKNTVFFGVEQNKYSKKQNDSVYNDGAYCPNCKEKMEYDFYHYSHIGSYYCKNCGHKRNDPKYKVTDINLEDKYAIIDGEYRLELFLNSMYQVYNSLAAFAVASEIGADKQKAVEAISNYVLKNGRLVTFKKDNIKGVLLTSKHENSVSYNQSIELVINAKKPLTVVFIVDAISRKYFTGEISWLWDIDFEKLDTPIAEKIILAGKYAYDLANRFEYTSIPKEKISVVQNISGLSNALSESKNDVAVITCFSDRDKLLDQVEIIPFEEYKLPF